MNLRLSRVLFSLALAVVMAANVNANGDLDTEKIVKSFVKHVETLDEVSKDKVESVKKLVEEVGVDSSDAVTEGLIELYPNYGSAIESSDNEDVDAAVKQLGPLADANDKFLAADASFYLARMLMNNERFEEALPKLNALTKDLADFSVHKGSAEYFTGVAEAGLLKNQDAIKSFMNFLSNNPNAPERLRVSAYRQVQQLQSIKAGKLDDVYQRMDFSRRRLALKSTGAQTQIEQDKIVDMLTKLIKEEEKKECSSNCKKGGT